MEMGSTAGDHAMNNDAPMEVVPKTEPLHDGSISSTVSTPEAEVETLAPDVVQTQKRKGGRKPVCLPVSIVLVLVLC